MKKILIQKDKYYIYTDNLDILSSDFYEKGLTLKELIVKIESNTKFFEEYEVSEEILSSLIEEKFINKAYLIPVLTLSQEMVKKLLDKEYFKLSDLKYLTLNTYLNFNKDFINEYQDHLNWNKIILRKANVTGLVSFNVLEKNKINELNLWDLASSFQLEKKFIKKNREKLNWDIIRITNDFTYDELSDYPELVNYKVDGIEEKIKPIEETTLNEDGFLAFDNVKPIDSEINEQLHKLRRDLLQKQNIQDADTKEIIEKMVALRKQNYKDFNPHIVGKEPKPEIKVEDIPETPNMVKFEDVFYEITKPEIKITEEIIEDAKVLKHNILSHTFSKTFTIPVGNIDPEIAKKDLGELILDGKTQYPYTKDIWFPHGEVSPNIEMITDTPSTPLTDIFIPVKEEKKVSIIGRIINKIRNRFHGK